MPDSREAWAEHDAILAARRPFRDFRLSRIDPLGRRRHLIVSGQPLFDSHGAFTGYRGIGRDITALIDAERLISETSARLWSALEGSTDAVAFWDVNDRLVVCNSAYRRLAGEAADMLEPGVEFAAYLRERLRLGKIDPGPAGPEAWLAERLAIHAGRSGAIETMRDGRWMLISEQRAPDGGTLLIARDITEFKERERLLREAKEQADAANRAKSSFLAHMSHELRTPLNAILGYAEVIRDRFFGPEATERYSESAETILLSGRHLLAIIDDLLDLTRIESEQVHLACETVELGGLLRDCLGMIEARVVAAGITLTQAIGREPAMLDADPRCLRQVVINLLSNALKFTPRGGTITVSLQAPPEGALCVIVADTGIGISESELDRVFEPFQRGESSESRRFEGTGLGLTISRRLMELHDGRILLDSSVGSGTTATLVFPAERRVAGSSD